MSKEKITQEIIRHYHSKGGIGIGGGLCVCAEHVTGNSYFTVSTSVCSIQDQYNKRVGVYNTRTAMARGKCINIPLTTEYNIYKLSRSELLASVDHHFQLFYYDDKFEFSRLSL